MYNIMNQYPVYLLYLRKRDSWKDLVLQSSLLQTHSWFDMIGLTSTKQIQRARDFFFLQKIKESLLNILSPHTKTICKDI